MIELHINESLIILLIVFSWLISGMLNIIAGAIKMEKSTNYDNGNIAFGLLQLVFVVIILIL